MMNSVAKAPRGPSWIRWIASAGAKLPTANTIVANRISHGMRLAKIAVGVHNSRSAPISPPTRKQCDHARCIRIDGIEPGKQQRRKCHQGSAAGERVQGAAEERGGDEHDGSHELGYVWLVRGSQRVTVAR